MSRVSSITKTADTKQVATLKRRIRDLETEVEKVTESLQRTRKSKHKIPVQGKLRTSRGAFVRVFLPDTHGHSVDPAALKAFLTDLAYLNPRELFLMGDHLDCGGFLAQHHVLGFVAETENTFESDVASANSMLDAVQTICPKADIKYLEGNHEARHNTGKPELSQLNHFRLEALAAHVAAGRDKYPDVDGQPNWKLGGKPDQEYLDAAHRHLTSFVRGEVYDGETGTMHLAAVAWNALACITNNYDEHPVKHEVTA